MNDSFTMTHAQLDSLLSKCEKQSYNQAINDAADFLDEKARLKHTVEATRYHQQLANDIRKLTK